MAPQILKFLCPTCFRVAKVDEKLQPFGKKLRCKGCKQKFTLSQENLETDEPSPNAATTWDKSSTKQELEKLFGTEQEKIPEKFDRFELVKELGRGGMGKVYQAYDPQFQRKVALKLLIGGTVTNDKESEKRFLREAEATAALNHPNIVKVHDIGYANGQYFFTMELVEGDSFYKFLRQSRTRSELLQVFLKIAQGVHYAHQQGIIHRDLKPANIMLTKDFQPKVMDFGLVKLLEESQKLTATGMIMGTLQYMAPEQALGDSKQIDYRADLYALAVILYEILTVRLPFEAESMNVLYNKIIQQQPVPPHQLRTDIPPELSKVCLKALEKNRKDRYSTVAEFAKAVIVACK